MRADVPELIFASRSDFRVWLQVTLRSMDIHDEIHLVQVQGSTAEGFREDY